MKHTWNLIALVTLTMLTAPLIVAQSQSGLDARDDARRRLQAATGGSTRINDHAATGTARFIRAADGRVLNPAVAPSAAAKEQLSRAFFRDYGALLGIADAAAMRLVASATDNLGETQLTWKQFVGLVPVYAGTIKTHFDASQHLKAVTGIAIPDINISVTPTWTAERAAATASATVVEARGAGVAVRIGQTTLYVYREGLAQGIPGPNHLAWEVEITDGLNIRDLVYVDAHNGKVIDRVAAVHDELYRRAYDGHSLPNAPANYPNGAYWLEGQTLPTASQEANNMVLASFDIYTLFQRAFGRDSFDAKGAKMDAIFDRGYDCPNASWNGTFISFCPGLTTDDITAHEWGHAYTQYTHQLIYQWQPGALNEAYSDIWGEVVDQINERGTDLPADMRTPGSCSTFTPPVAQLVVVAPASIAGSYFAQSAFFGPELTGTGLSGEVVAAVDAADAAGSSTLDACSTISNAAAVSGKLALVDRGGCEFSTKVLKAQQAGAIGVIIANNVVSGLPGMGAGVDAPQVMIPSIGVQQATGTSLRTELSGGATVSASLQATPGTDASYKWLMGEDASGGALRDMSNPTCMSNPAKVSDTGYYACSSDDQGGVHTNSGVPNHTFALIADGGVYNGRTIAPIGLTKAAHIYYRAQSKYQVESSDFADHADALEAACVDLIGKPLNALTGGISSEVIGSSDCAQVTTAIAATELRTPPSFCNFAPILNPALPAFCSPSTTTGGSIIASFDFESGADGWMASRANSSPDFTPRDWSLVTTLPSPKSGTAFFAPDPSIGTCLPGGDESGVLQLTSPEIVLPSSTAFARAAFEHWFATEPGFDGTNLQVSVNGGPWQLVPPTEITFNNYNATLFSAAQGNTDPLAGQPAWTGANAGGVDAGSWGRTHVNLDNFARAGDRVRLRWNLGTDGCAGRVGTFLDNVSVFSCSPNVPTVAINDLTITEGNAGTTTAQFTVQLSQPTIRAVSLQYQTVDGTAIHGNDFERAAGTLIIPAGAASARIAVVIKGDIVVEGAETFRVVLSGVANATVVDAEAVGTIGEDDATTGPPQH